MRFNRAALAGFLAIAFVSLSAQSPSPGIQPSGSPVAGNCVKWGADKWHAADAGAPCGAGTAGVTSFNTRTGAVTPQAGDYTAALVGLGSVTNDAQTKAAIVPNTTPTAGQMLIGNAGGTAYAPQTQSGDCTTASTGAITCTKTGGVAFAPSATIDTTNASNISSGTLNGARLPGGLWSNTLNAITAVYSIASTDCGKTISATGGYYAITLPAVTGFSTTCILAVQNSETGAGAHAKLLSGFPGAWSGGRRLWPDQTIMVGIVNGAWKIISDPGRWRNSNPIIYVDVTNGSDSTGVDGLGGTTDAFKSFTYAYNTMRDQVDLIGGYVTAYFATGAFPSNQQFAGPLFDCGYQADLGEAPYGACFQITGTGYTTNGITTSAATELLVIEGGASVETNNLYLSSTTVNGTLVNCANSGFYFATATQFQAAAFTQVHATMGCKVYATANYWFGTAQYGFVFEDGSRGIVNGANTLIGTPSWTGGVNSAFMTIGLQSYVDAVGFTFTGGGTGLEAYLNNLGVVYTGGAAQAGFFPGNTTPTVDAATFALWK